MAIHNGILGTRLAPCPEGNKCRWSTNLQNWSTRRKGWTHGLKHSNKKTSKFIILNHLSIVSISVVPEKEIWRIKVQNSEYQLITIFQRKILTVTWILSNIPHVKKKGKKTPGIKATDRISRDLTIMSHSHTQRTPLGAFLFTFPRQLLGSAKKYPEIPSLKLTFSPLKMDGWKTILSFWDGLCSGAILVSGRVIIISDEIMTHHRFSRCSFRFARIWEWNQNPDTLKAVEAFFGFHGFRHEDVLHSNYHFAVEWPHPKCQIAPAEKKKQL